MKILKQKKRSLFYKQNASTTCKYKQLLKCKYEYNFTTYVNVYATSEFAIMCNKYLK